MSKFSGVEVRDSEKLGRFLIAKKEYRKNDLILEEEPILVTPTDIKAIKPSCQDLQEDITNLQFNCVGCFKILSPENTKFCRKCNWRICSNNCEQESLHTRYECSLFEEKKIVVSAEVYDRIYILRALLMSRDENNPTPWKNFTALSSSYVLNQEDCRATTEEEIQAVTQFLRDRFQMNVDQKTITHIIGAFKVNGFEITGEDEYGSSYKGLAVYSVASMFAHNCAPNGEWVVFPADYNGIRRWHLRVYARRNILCNEPINIAYIPDCFALDSAARRSYISQHLDFDCQCSRCDDKTDFSLYTEAIKCPSCGDETLTADNPSDQFSNWTCNHCKMCTPPSFTNKCVDIFHASLGYIWLSPSHTALEMLITSSIEKCGLGQTHREIILATFLWIRTHAIKLFEDLSQHSRESDEIFAKFLKAASKCLKVFRMFGKMTDVVYLEFCFARAIASYYFKTVDFRSLQYDPYFPEEKFKITTAICAPLKMAVVTLEWYPFNYFPLDLKKGLVDGYKFWNDELNALKELRSVDLRESSNELSGVGVKVKNTVAELKTSSNESSDPLTKNAHEESSAEVLKEAGDMNKVTVSQSSDLLPCDVITSSGDFNLILRKPSLSLLTTLDSYFDA